jgi:hypothetical protein
MADIIAIDVAYTAAAIQRMLDAYPELLEDDSLRVDSISGETPLPELMSKLVRLRQERLAMVSGLDAYLEELGLRRARLVRGAEGLKGLMLRLMSTARLPSLVLPEASIGISKGRNTVSITDLEALPQGYFTTTRQADKAAIKSALESGEDVPGAALVIGESVLTVRCK